MAQLHRLIYGKPVQYPDGPIVKGAEHGFIGSSDGFNTLPESLRSQIPGGGYYIGGDTLEYALRHNPVHGDEIGFGIYKVAVPEGDFIVAHRHRIPSEGGPGARDRHYKQRMIGIMRAEDWSPQMVVSLYNALEDPKLTSHDKNLPTLDIQERPLHFDNHFVGLPHVWQTVAAVMSGQRISIEDKDRPIPEQLCIMQACLSALPSRVAARLSSGTQIATMHTPENPAAPAPYKSGMVDVGIGQWGTNGVRLHGGELKLPPAAGNLDRGMAYLEFLTDLARGCTNTADVQAKVAHSMDLAGIGPGPGQWTWQENAAGTCSILQKKMGWLRPYKDTPLQAQQPQYSAPQPKTR